MYMKFIFFCGSDESDPGMVAAKNTAKEEITVKKRIFLVEDEEKTQGCIAEYLIVKGGSGRCDSCI